MQVSIKTLFLLLCMAILAGCSTAPLSGSTGKWAGHKESGQASYYADKFQNRKTASGQLYKPNLKTAAHRTLPFATTVRVTNVKNGKSVVARINDRGPVVRGRIIDPSAPACSRLCST